MIRKALPQYGGWLAALLLLNLGLKLAWTGVNELSGDEPFTVYWASRPLGELWALLRSENNPPLFFLLMHYWERLFPLDPAWLRIPSALFSALTVWPLYLLGRRLGGTVAGLTAGLIFTFSTHSYAFAHEVRAYALLVLACTWAAWQMVRLADDHERFPSLRPATIGWLVAANVLATWAHYFGWLMVGIQVILVFAVPRLRPVRAKMLATAFVTLLLNLPVLGILRHRAGESLGQGTWLSPPTWEEPYNMLLRWANAPVVAVFFLALVGYTLWKRRGRYGDLAIPLYWTWLPLLGMFVVSVRFPIYLDRYLLFASPGFYLLVALSAAELPRKGKLNLFGSALCVAAMAGTFKPWQGNGQHPSDVVAQVQAWRGGQGAVIIQPPWYQLTYAWANDRTMFRGATPLPLALREGNILAVHDTMPVLDPTITTVVHVDAWAGLPDPQFRVLGQLRERFTQIDSVEADKKVVVRLFEVK